MLEIHIVRPENEDLYAKRTKESFLDGKLDRDLRLDNQKILTPGSNTNVQPTKNRIAKRHVSYPLEYTWGLREVESSDCRTNNFDYVVKP